MLFVRRIGDRFAEVGISRHGPALHRIASRLCQLFLFRGVAIGLLRNRLFFVRVELAIVKVYYESPILGHAMIVNAMASNPPLTTIPFMLTVLRIPTTPSFA